MNFDFHNPEEDSQDLLGDVLIAYCILMAFVVAKDIIVYLCYGMWQPSKNPKKPVQYNEQPEQPKELPSKQPSKPGKKPGKIRSLLLSKETIFIIFFLLLVSLHLVAFSK